MKKLLLLVMTMLLAAPAGWACRCRLGLTMAEHYREHDVVVVATVLRIDVRVGPQADSAVVRRFRQKGWTVIIDSSFTAWASLKRTFKLTRTYKGVVNDSIFEVAAGWGGPDCGVGFEVGKAYLIYANRRDGHYSTSRCAGTKEYDDAEASQLEELQRHPPQPVAPKPKKGWRKAAAK